MGADCKRAQRHGGPYVHVELDRHRALSLRLEIEPVPQGREFERDALERVARRGRSREPEGEGRQRQPRGRERITACHLRWRDRLLLAEDDLEEIRPRRLVGEPQPAVHEIDGERGRCHAIQEVADITHRGAVLPPGGQHAVEIHVNPRAVPQAEGEFRPSRQKVGQVEVPERVDEGGIERDAAVGQAGGVALGHAADERERGGIDMDRRGAAAGHVDRHDRRQRRPQRAGVEDERQAGVGRLEFKRHAELQSLRGHAPLHVKRGPVTGLAGRAEELRQFVEEIVGCLESEIALRRPQAGDKIGNPAADLDDLPDRLTDERHIEPLEERWRHPFELHKERSEVVGRHNAEGGEAKLTRGGESAPFAGREGARLPVHTRTGIGVFQECERERRDVGRLVEKPGGADPDPQLGAGLSEAADAERERNRHLEAAVDRGNDSERLTRRHAKYFAESLGAARQINGGGHVEVDVDIGRTEPDAAERGVEVSQRGCARVRRAGEDPQCADIDPHCLLGREVGSEIDPKRHASGIAGRHVDLERLEPQAPVVERLLARDRRRPLAHVEREVNQLPAAGEVDIEPERAVAGLADRDRPGRREPLNGGLHHRGRDRPLDASEVRCQRLGDMAAKLVAHRQDRADRLRDAHGLFGQRTRELHRRDLLCKDLDAPQKRRRLGDGEIGCKDLARLEALQTESPLPRPLLKPRAAAPPPHTPILRQSRGHATSPW